MNEKNKTEVTYELTQKKSHNVKMLTTVMRQRLK